MASLQRIGQSGGTVSAVSYGSGKCGSELVASDQFPVGLRVLVVDDDATCLRVLDKMLRRCLYTVTSCSQATVALDLLREKKGGFDVVLSDVHMPDMDGFKLLEYIGLEMDLPVIMMSADGRTSAVMKGIRHGACDYLIKPIREEELKNIWQHVVRKKWTENKEPENSGSLGDNERSRRGNDDSAENASSGNEGTEGIPRVQRKRSNAKEDDGELENEDPSSSKKPRVVWSVELHQQFVSAVNQLGLEKAVPKRILELMNVPGLTRENVASHLQKFRLYLKRLSGVAQQQNVISNPYCGAIEPHVNAGAFGIQNLAPSGSQIPPQTLAALHAELLGQPNSNLIDQPALLQASLHGTNNILVGQGVSYGQPSVTFLPNISKHYQPSNMPFEDVSSGNRVWQQCNNLGPIGSNNLGGLSPQNSNMLLGVLQQQQRNQYSVASEPSHSINVQPSCLVIPSHQSSTSFQAGNSPASVNQNLSYNKSSVIDYTLIPPQSNNSLLNIGQVSGRDLKNMSILTGYTAPRSISPSASSSSVNAGNSNGQNVQNSTLTFTARKFPGPAVNIRDIQGSSYGSRSGEGLDQGPLQNLGFVGKGTIIPSRYAVDEFEAPISNLAHDNVNRVKQEPSMEFVDSEKMGIPLLKQSPNDLMGVFLE